MKNCTKVLVLIVALACVMSMFSVFAFADAAPLVTVSSTKIELSGISSSYQYALMLTSSVPAESDWLSIADSTTSYTFSGLTPDTSYYLYMKQKGTDTAADLQPFATAKTAPVLVRDYLSTTSIKFSIKNFTKMVISDSLDISTRDWIYLASTVSKNYPVSDTESCYYAVQTNYGQITFSSLTTGKLYYVYGQTADGRTSDPYVFAIAPNISDVSAGNGVVTVPYSAINRYSIDGSDFITATSVVKTVTTSSGETVTCRSTSSGVQFSGLRSSTTYTISAAVYYNDEQVSSVVSVTGRTSNTSPSAPKLLSATETSLRVLYTEDVIYRINNSDWTGSNTSLYTRDNPGYLGTISYYFEPNMIIFKNLTVGTTYSVSAKYSNDLTNTNASTTEMSTKACNHVYGPRTYFPDGLTYTETCTLCGYVNEGRDEVCQHVFTHTVVVDPTCSEPGYTVQVCDTCRQEATERVMNYNLLPHTYDNACDPTCNVCGSIREITHAYEKVTVDPTCSSVGYIQEVCAVCGHVNEDFYEEIPKLDHTPGEWVVVKEPTIDEDGERAVYCTVCHTVLNSEVISRYQIVDNEDGTKTYWFTSDKPTLVLSSFAKTIGSTGNMAIRFSNEQISVRFDSVMTVSFVPTGSTLTVSRITDASKASGNLDKAGYSLDDSTLAVYEITASGIVTVGSGTASVTVPYECADGMTAAVYYVGSDGKTEKCKSVTNVDGTVTFETSHFSTYVVKSEKAGSLVSGNVVTILIITIAAIVIATLATFAYIVITAKKNRKRKFRF